MKKRYILAFITALFSSIQGMEGPLSTSRVVGEASSQQSFYRLPDRVDTEKLVQSSVIIQCGTVRGGGIAISDKFILTAAHNLTAAVLDKAKIHCFAVGSYQQEFNVPLKELFVDAAGRGCYIPDFHRSSSLRELAISRFHMLPHTCMREMEGSDTRMVNLQELLEKLEETLEYGLKTAEKYASYGWETEFKKDGETSLSKALILGPDIALLECAESHKLPTIQISEPLNDDRHLVHVVGITGNRYANESVSSLTGGTVCLTKDGPAFIFSPRITGQRFRCLPAYSHNLKLWFNRPFLRIMGNSRYFMHDEIYPKAPQGFGLLTAGDSGSGAFVVKEGKPYLVGVSNSGQVQHIFVSIHNILEEENFDLARLKHHPGGEILWNIYHRSIKTADKDQKWFITQALADVTHLKPWIDSIVNNNSKIPQIFKAGQ